MGYITKETLIRMLSLSIPDTAIIRISVEVTKSESGPRHINSNGSPNMAILPIVHEDQIYTIEVKL